MLNAGLILIAILIVIFKTPNHFAFGGTSGVSVILSTLFPELPVSTFMWIINAVLVAIGHIFPDRKAVDWSVFASFALSACMSLIEWLVPLHASITGDMWLDLCIAAVQADTSKDCTETCTVRVSQGDGAPNFTLLEMDVYGN